jgi:excisionase family DNA binding protein
MMRGSRPPLPFRPREAEEGSAPEPLTVRVSRAVQLSGLSRSRIYELIQSGDLETHKVGGTTLIPYRSLKHLVTGVD